MPLPLDGLAMWFRAYDDINLADTGAVCLWKDSAGTPYVFAQKKDDAMPSYNASFAGQFPAIVFDGATDRLDSKLKATNLSVSTFFLAFKTGDNVATRQVLWAWGDKDCGMNIYLQNSNVYMGCWSLKGKYAWGQKFINAPNGVAIAAVNDVKSLDRVKDMSLGGVIRSTYFHTAQPGSESFYAGALMELIVYDAILDANQTLQVQSYLGGEYGISFPQ